MRLVSERVRFTGGKRSTRVVTGVGSLLSGKVVRGLCRTSRTKMGVRLVIHNVYILVPKVPKTDSGVAIHDVIKHFLRRDEVF